MMGDQSGGHVVAACGEALMKVRLLRSAVQRIFDKASLELHDVWILQHFGSHEFYKWRKRAAASIAQAVE